MVKEEIYQILEKIHEKSIEEFPEAIENIIKKTSKFLKMTCNIEYHFLINDQEDIIGFEMEIGVKK